MGEQTNIGWTRRSLNFWSGCVEQEMANGEESPACTNCYAKAMAKRNPSVLGRWGGVDDGGTRVARTDKIWRTVTDWNRKASIEGERHMIFMDSMSDFFEGWSGPVLDHKGNQLFVHSRDVWLAEKTHCPLTLDHIRSRAIRQILITPNLIYQCLTKRPDNVNQMMEVASQSRLIDNLWIGATIECQQALDDRIAELLAIEYTPVRFISIEPMFDPLDFECVNLSGIQWVIVGCEKIGSSKPGRPTKLEWVRELRDHCHASGVPLFVKQLEIDGKVSADVHTFPSDLQIQQFPQQKACDDGIR